MWQWALVASEEFLEETTGLYDHNLTFYLELLLVQKLRGGKVVASLFAVTESTESASTKAEGRATEMQPETGWFFLQKYW